MRTSPLDSFCVLLLVLVACTSLACNSAQETNDASSDAVACDPLDAGGGDAPAEECGTSDSGVIDLDCGSQAPPGHFTCYVDLGGDALVSNCTGSLTCCDLKSECYDPAQEPGFCLRPYCQ